MSELIHFTEAARHYIKDQLSKNQGLGFRISIKKTGCSGYSYVPTVISQAVAGDIHMELAGEMNIYLDPDCLAYIKGLTIDFVEEKKEGQLKQKKLVFMNPNEKGRCGCGESFHV